MLRLFLCAVGLAVTSFLAHAVFSVFYESGAFLYAAPVMFAVVAGTFALVPLRLRWNWRLVWHWSWAWSLIQLVFFPDAAHFGPLVNWARVLAAVEIAACVAVFAAMRNETVKAWLAARGAAGARLA